MEKMTKPLEKLRAGDAVRYDGVAWFVQNKSIYKESEDYQEIQWTLRSKERGEYYLVRSEEKIETGFQYQWVFTKQINLSEIEYQPSGDTWEYFVEQDFVISPPQNIRFNNLIFNFDSETSGKAKDDEGQTVTKLTWDYYDEAKTRNLAIEVWKEQDRDYPEAYDGIVVEPYKFSILPASDAIQLKAQFKKWQAPVVSYLCILFTVFIMGMPLDVALAFSIPILAVYMVIRTFGLPRWLAFASPLVWIAMLIMFIAMRFNAPFWIVTAYGVIIATVISRMCTSVLSQGERCYYTLISLTGLLPAVWLYSFLMYFRFAPGPHTVSQLLATCTLPLLPTAICYALNFYLEKTYDAA